MVITCNCYARKLGRYCFVVEIGEKNDIDIDIPMACSRVGVCRVSKSPLRSWFLVHQKHALAWELCTKDTYMT